MDVKALQTRLRDFAAARDWQPYHSPKNLAMALMVEAAELLELFQWKTITESRGLTRNPADKERVADEIADVLLYLLQLADHTDVDVEEAVERKLRKNAEKHPAKHREAQPCVSSSSPAKVHLLVDWENVQPTGEALKALVPEGTDAWLFHGPNQKLDDSGHKSIFGECVVRVPRSGVGRNALDFQLTYYVGYIAARQPQATFVIVSNDQGYDPMLEHARELGFKARRCEFRKPSGTKPPSSPAALPAPGPAPAVQARPALTVSAIRQDVQLLAQWLQAMPPAQRPAHKEGLLVLLQSLLGEIGMVSPRVTGALAQLQAQRHVVLKGNGVSYPGSPAAPAIPPPMAKKEQTVPAKKKVTPAKKKAAPAKKVAAPVKAAAVKSAPKPTAAQVADAVLASLRKMPKNKPTRRAGLLKHIESHAAKAADPKAMAQQVCALLEAHKEVAVAADGKSVAYPKKK